MFKVCPTYTLTSTHCPLTTDSSSVQGPEFSLASVSKLQLRYCGPEMTEQAAVALLPLHLPDTIIKSHQRFDIMEANQLQQKKDFIAQLSHDLLTAAIYLPS